MIVTKLFSSEKIALEPKPIRQKPKHKTYRELLQLDRPKKQIEYESSSEEEDFLEKLLKEEKKKQKKPKSTARKNSSQNEARGNKEEKKPMQVVKKESRQSKRKTDQAEEAQKDKKQNKQMDEIQMFLAQSSNQTNKYEYLLKEDNPESTSKQTKPIKSRSITQFKSYTKVDKSKILRRDMAMSNPILIDTKSIESPPIIFNANNHTFNNTLRPKQSTNAYEQLLAQKQNYQRQYKTSNKFDNQIIQGQIEHKVNSPLPDCYSFEPNIEPLNRNWRIAMTLNPLASKPPSKFTDRKNLFKSQRQQERFIQSLRQLSRLRI